MVEEAPSTSATTRRTLVAATLGGGIGTLATVSAWTALHETPIGPPDGPQRALRHVSLRDYGAVGDGIHDDTAAFEAAVAACNDAGTRENGYRSGWTLHVPAGDYVVPEGVTTRVTVDGVTIQGESASSTRIIIDHGTLLTWGDETSFVKGGGAEGLTIFARLGEQTTCFDLENCASLTFRSLVVYRVSTIARLGSGAYDKSRCNGAIFSIIRGWIANSGYPAFHLGHGAGLYLSQVDLVCEGVEHPKSATDPVDSADGTTLITAGDRSWDTIMLSQVITNRFHSGIKVKCADKSVVSNLFASNVVLDYCAENAVIVDASLGGAATKLSFTNCYLVSLVSHAVHVTSAPKGNVREIYFTSCVVVLSGMNAWRIGPQVRGVMLQGCSSFGANRSRALPNSVDTAALAFESSDWQVIGGRHGEDGDYFNGYSTQADYGMHIAATCDHYAVSSVQLTGAASSMSLQRHPEASPHRNISGMPPPTSLSAQADFVQTSSGSWRHENRSAFVTSVQLTTASSVITAISDRALPSAVAASTAVLKPGDWIQVANTTRPSAIVSHLP